ncbi:MAG: hypothetical protein FJ088_08025, partial [Deltaproteobacteria bacterium]|nr:hypothetical protein [Deltaproteobacteria bacterium]
MKKINVLLIFLFVLSRCSSGGEVTSEIQVGDAADEESQFAEEEIAEAADDLLYESEGEFIPEKGGFLYPCETNDECLSGFCVEGEDGFFCTIKCLEDCPEGFACQGVLVTWPE